MSPNHLGASTPSLAADANALGALRRQAGQNNPAAVKEAARQFESMFMRELIKSMREATMKSGMLDSAQENISRDLLDQQLAVQMSGRPGGLSELIERQLSQKLAPDTTNTSSKTAQVTARGLTQGTGAAAGSAAFNGRQSSFVQEHRAAAARVEQNTGIPASYMLGQAGHETGWGKSQIRMSDGSPSFNLFGIKAGANWSGKVAEVTTTEYINGQPQKVTAKFRAYDSYEASFRDYAQLIGQSPRYAQAKQNTHSVQAYTSELQRAGYATDPQYADKLSRAINSALRLQRLQT